MQISRKFILIAIKSGVQESYLKDAIKFSYVSPVCLPGLICSYNNLFMDDNMKMCVDLYRYITQESQSFNREQGLLSLQDNVFYITANTF